MSDRAPVLQRDERDVCQVLTHAGWRAVELVGAGRLQRAGRGWVCSPAEFARRYQLDLARLVRHLGTVVDPDVADEVLR